MQRWNLLADEKLGWNYEAIKVAKRILNLYQLVDVKYSSLKIQLPKHDNNLMGFLF